MDKRRVNKLVREIARGNTAAAEELYALMKRPLMSFAAPSLRDFPEAEDVVQSVFLKIIQKSREMTYFTDAFAWIFKIARNECNDRLRARSRIGTSVSGSSCPLPVRKTTRSILRAKAKTWRARCCIRTGRKARTCTPSNTAGCIIISRAARPSRKR